MPRPVFSLLPAFAFCALVSAQSPMRAPLANASFDEAADGRPIAWKFRSFPTNSYVFEAVRGRHAGGGRLRFVGGETNGQLSASIFQSVDPSAYRGRTVRIRVMMRPNPSMSTPSLFLTVIRFNGAVSGNVSSSPTKSLQADGWRAYEITARVAPDAKEMLLGVGVRGQTTVVADDLSLTVLKRSSTPASPAALAYLDKALATIRRYHVNAARGDWDDVAADARATAAGARVPTDTYPAIRDAIGRLGEIHSGFVPPASPRLATGQLEQRKLPSSRLLHGRIGVVTLPGLMTANGGGDRLGRSYRIALRSQLQKLDQNSLCGWIVDLRKNSGGDMWPMLNGLDPLLGAEPFGLFVDRDGTRSYWRRSPPGIFATTAVPPKKAPHPSYGLTHASLPVAVVIDRTTASSGEMVAIALIGRPGVRTFGGRTAGLATANQTFAMPDGANLVLTIGGARDRNDTDYATGIRPDELISGTDPIPDAAAWLETQCPVAPRPTID